MRPITTLLLALVLLACGASARQHTISAALVAADASRDAFVAFDAAHQQQLVATAASLDDGRQRLEAYRKQRDPIVQGFAMAYRAIATAAILTDDPTSIPNMIRAASMLRDALKELGVSP